MSDLNSLWDWVGLYQMQDHVLEHAYLFNWNRFGIWNDWMGEKQIFVHMAIQFFSAILYLQKISKRMRFDSHIGICYKLIFKCFMRPSITYLKVYGLWFKNTELPR